MVASAIALAEAVPDPELRPEALALHKGESVDLGDVAELLADAGYERVEQVEERGQFAVRGGILDVYPATEERAVRVELFGDEIESLRWFSVFTQRSLGEAERVELAPAAELAAEHRDDAGLAGRRGRGRARPGSRSCCRSTASSRRSTWSRTRPWSRSPPPRRSRGRCTTTGRTSPRRCTTRTPAGSTSTSPSRSPSAPRSRCRGRRRARSTRFRAQRAEFPSRTPAEAEGELEKLVRSGYRTVVAFERRGEAERARYNLARIDAAVPRRRSRREEPGVSFAEAQPARGLPGPRAEAGGDPASARLVHRRRAAAAPRRPGRGIAAAIELRVGDYVVHEDHGVARFSGFDTKTLAGVTRDYLELEYRGGDKVFAPTDQLAKISRYVGADGGEPAAQRRSAASAGRT